MCSNAISSSAAPSSFLSLAFTQRLPFSFPCSIHRLLSRERLCSDDLDGDTLYFLCRHFHIEVIGRDGPDRNTELCVLGSMFWRNLRAAGLESCCKYYLFTWSSIDLYKRTRILRNPIYLRADGYNSANVVKLWWRG